VVKVSASMAPLYRSSSKNASPYASREGSRAPSLEQAGASTLATSVPSTAMDQTPDDSSKLRTFLSILKRFIGVSDMAAVRFSLPAQLLEPIPNLGTSYTVETQARHLIALYTLPILVESLTGKAEYWHYLDRPETFARFGSLSMFRTVADQVQHCGLRCSSRSNAWCAAVLVHERLSTAHLLYLRKKWR